ncbi:MAG: TIR domain-containing protein [Candidatus Heimdallarchaeaceae archaeon]
MPWFINFLLGTLHFQLLIIYKDIKSTDSETVEVETNTLHPILVDKRKPNQIFVVHGKNRKPVEQLKVILDKFKIPYKIAIDEPHKGRPISKKVEDLMRVCTSAIIIFTADEKYLNEEGTEIWRPSDNAVYELGAASILYDKIVILKEKSVTLGSDFSDIGYISFEKDQVEAKAMELMMEFIGLGFVQVTST